MARLAGRCNLFILQLGVAMKKNKEGILCIGKRKNWIMTF
jgi:hypothetical protein